MNRATLKVRKCSACRDPFMQQRSMQKVCSPLCAEKDAEARRLKQEAARARDERKQDRATRESRKTLPELIAEADTAFQAFIRERDRQAGHLCISSGQPLDWSGNKTDAGHYRSKGAASHLRYNEDNCHAQTKQENRFKAGNAVDYRIHLIARIGLARVEALETSNAPHKWQKDEVRAIRDHYRARLKQLKREAK